MFAIAQMVGDYAGYRLADKKVDEIEHSLANLEDFPHIGTVRNEIVPGALCRPPKKPPFASSSTMKPA
jgi:hypothetical protein